MNEIESGMGSCIVGMESLFDTIHALCCSE